MGIWHYLAFRAATLVPVIIGVTFVTFFLIHLVPSDPAVLLAGPHATKDVVESIRHQWGLDQPLHAQYLSYLARLLSGDFGRSISTGHPVLEDLSTFFPATFELTTISLAWALLLGLTFGILSSSRRGKFSDFAIRLSALTGTSMPVFWLGMMLILLTFSQPWLAFQGRISISIQPPNSVTGLYLIDSLLEGNGAAFLSSLQHITLPALTLCLYTFGRFARMTRATMLDVLNQDFIVAARARGLPARVITLKYALKNALLPIITLSAYIYGLFLGGSILTETIFSWPGIGLYSFNAILNLDYPAILGFATMMAIIYVVINLIVDVLYVAVDPRVKY